MSKKLSGVVVVAVIASVGCGAMPAGARPASARTTIKLGFITKFPVDFYFILVDAAKK